MQYVNLGKTGTKVSRICLGCMTFGEPDRGCHAWALGEEQSRPLIKKALELGINFLETANSYSDGTSEEIVGRALRDFAKRDEVVLATKVFYPGGTLDNPLPNTWGLSGGAARRGQGRQGELNRRLVDVRLAVRQGAARGGAPRLDPLRHHAEPRQLYQP